MKTTNQHEMRMVAGRIRAIYTDGREYYVRDGERVYLGPEEHADPTQDDMDSLPVGPDLTDDEIETLPE